MEEKLNENIPPSLITWLGGVERLELLTEVFYKKVTQDSLIGPIFRNMSPNHTKRVAHFIGEVFGGAKLYTELDEGSHSSMVEHHMGKHLTEEHRKRWVNLLLETADEVGLPDDPEFRSAFVGYIEWGSRLAVLNSSSNDNPISKSEPMPKWGWGETGGPYQG